MENKINEILETLKEGEETTLVLKNGEQMTGLFGGVDGDDVILKSKDKNTPSLGWSKKDISDIFSEASGEVVRIDIVDVKTSKKVVATLDFSGEDKNTKVTFEYVPEVSAEGKDLYVSVAHMILKALV